MANPRLPLEVMQRTVDAVIAAGGSATAAALTCGIPRNTIEGHLRSAVIAGLVTREALAALRRGDAVPELSRAFTVPALPSEVASAAELLARRSKQFARKKDAKEARHLVPVTVHLDGPVGVCFPGDPHLDDDGTDIDLIREHNRIILGTDGLFALLMGDFTNNWIGNLARIYAQQGCTASEAWVLAEWYIRELEPKILAAIAGNHDLWSGAGDPIKWMAASARVAYEANGIRLGLTFPNGRVIRVNGRHDFSGHSQWNTAHGPAKAAQMGWRDHILVAAHKHTSGYQVVRDPESGLLSHCVRAGSYKTYDRYAEEKGLPNQTFTVCPVAVIDPEQPDDSARCVTIFFDPAEGADYLTFKRKKWARKRAS